jgi:hypothetical protein
MVAHDIVHSFSGEYLDDLKTSVFSLRAAHKFTRRFGVQINIRNTGCLHMIPSDVYNFPPLPSRNLLQGPDDFLCSINSSKHLTTMRVLLLGATGNLGSRCLPALVAHKHVVTVFVRNSSKLRAMMSPALLAEANAIAEGDATDSTALEKAILDHDIEGIIDVAGNIVPPWKEFLLPKIASAVRDAAVAVGKQRGKPLRAWITSHLGILEYPGTSYLIQDLYDIHFLL